MRTNDMQPVKLRSWSEYFLKKVIAFNSSSRTGRKISSDSEANGKPADFDDSGKIDLSIKSEGVYKT